MLASYLEAPNCQMMMIFNKLRVVPLTRHIPIQEVSRALSPGHIESSLTVVHRSLEQDFGIAAPRIAVTGLNPHAGEDGLLVTRCTWSPRRRDTIAAH